MKKIVVAVLMEVIVENDELVEKIEGLLEGFTFYEAMCITKRGNATLYTQNIYGPVVKEVKQLFELPNVVKV